LLSSINALFMIKHKGHKNVKVQQSPKINTMLVLSTCI